MIKAKNYTCYSCQKTCTRGDPSLIRASGKLYHKQCFRCNCCGVSVLEKFYLTKKEEILCEEDYYKCRHCKKTILNQQDLQEFGDYKYHTNCLVCPGCTITPTTIRSQPDYFDYNGRLYCRYHYSLIKGVECLGCGQAVFDQQDEWHTECFMIHKYWQVSLRTKENHYSDSNDYLNIQNKYATKRSKMWKILCEFEKESSEIIKNILLSLSYSTCYELVQQITTVFQTLDFIYSLSIQQNTNFQCEKPVQLLMDQVVSFFHILHEKKSRFEKEYMVKMAQLISQYLRELVRLSLQQSLVLERKESHVMNRVLDIFFNANHSITYEYLIQCIRLLEITLKDQEVPVTDHNKSTSPPFLSSNKNMVGSTPTLHLQSQDIPVRRSVSTKYVQTLPTTTNSRIESLKRALTTHKKNIKQNSQQKPLIVNTPPLFISLSEIPNNTSPPLSPPSAVQHHQHIWTIPNLLPELNSTQDSILRHAALLFIERHITDLGFIFNLDDYLLLDSKKPSLWGKLKAHILTPNGSTLIDMSQPTMVLSSRRIGVSLCQLSPSCFSYSNHTDPLLDKWISVSPSVASCFSSTALIPTFLKDCIISMINQDMNTEGIFRKNGNIRTLKEMCETLNSQCQEDPEQWADFFSQYPIIQLAAFIKKFTRDLPEPLLTFKLHRLFLMSAKSESRLHYALCLLPKANRDTFFLIMALLNWVAKKSDANKMDIENLARVMTPNILYPEPTSKKSLEPSICQEINVIAFMIESFEKFIKVPNDVLCLLENPKLTEHVFSNNIDLTSTKHFSRHFNHLLKIKKEVIPVPLITPSPSVSSNI